MLRMASESHSLEVMAMRYVRCVADEDGETHWVDAEFELTMEVFAPPAPPLRRSTTLAATGVLATEFPVGWVGDWHPTPERQFFFILAGTIEGECSDGERRVCPPGSVVLLEDVSGKGHRSWVVGDLPVSAAVVRLPI
jgi:hypothetical protein